MEHLRQSDLRTLLGFLRDCYVFREFETNEQFLRHLVTALTQLVPANAAFYMETNTNIKNSYHVGTQSYIEVSDAITNWRQHGQEHPSALHIMRTGDRSAQSISEFWSRRQFHSTRLYSTLYQPYSVQDDLALPISFGHPVTVVGWHSDRIFTGRERFMANLAGPHIIQTWQNAKSASETYCQLQLFKQGVESAASGIISCGGDGRIFFNTALARHYLVEYFYVSRNLDHHLPGDLLRWMQHENAELLKNDVPPVRLPLVIQKANKRLTVRLLSNDGANLLLFEEKGVSPDIDALSALGLSPRESEVLAWVAQGKTNGEIASILNMNLGTVKKHLVNIFRKLGVETRTAAAALALSARFASERGDR